MASRLYRVIFYTVAICGDGGAVAYSYSAVIFGVNRDMVVLILLGVRNRAAVVGNNRAGSYLYFTLTVRPYSTAALTINVAIQFGVVAHDDFSGFRRQNGGAVVPGVNLAAVPDTDETIIPTGKDPPRRPRFIGCGARLLIAAS